VWLASRARHFQNCPQSWGAAFSHVVRKLFRRPYPLWQSAEYTSRSDSSLVVVLEADEGSLEANLTRASSGNQQPRHRSSRVHIAATGIYQISAKTRGEGEAVVDAKKAERTDQHVYVEGVNVTHENAVGSPRSRRSRAFVRSAARLRKSVRLDHELRALHVLLAYQSTEVGIRLVTIERQLRELAKGRDRVEVFNLDVGLHDTNVS